MMILIQCILFLLSLINLIACDDENSIFDIIVRDKKLTEFTKQLEHLNMTSYMKDLTDATVFAPMDDAFEGYGNLMVDQLLYHIIRPNHTTDDLKDGMLLSTEANQWIKISSKDDNILIGNAQILNDKKDIKATNGYIHIIDSVLNLPTSLSDTITAHPDLQEFSERMHQSGVEKSLEKKKTNHTVFAIPGHLFDDIDPLQKSYLETPQAKKDVARLLNYLVVPETYYTKDFKRGKTILKTVNSEELVIVKNDKGITVNGIKLVEQDILASNGVVHILQDPLLPKDMDEFLKMNTRKALAGMNHGARLVDLYDHYNLSIYLDNENDVITVLAPDEMDSDLVPGNKIQSWLKYHIIQGYYPPGDLKPHQLLITKSHDEMGPKEYQRIKVHIDNSALNKPSIQFGKISVLGDPVYVNKNLLIYRISHSLYLPRGPLRQMPTNHELSTFVASLYGTDVGNKIKGAHAITLFAPTNNAFDRLGLVSKFLLQPEAKEKLAEVLKYHAVRRLFYDPSDIKPGKYREPTMAGPEIQINRTSDGELYFGDAKVSGMMLTANGVIHTIDRVQLDPDLEVTNRNLTAAEDLHSFISLVEKTGLTHVLDDPTESYTILAPNDRAFSQLDLEDLLNDRAKLESLVRLHIIPTRFPELSDVLNINKIGFTGSQFDTMLPDHRVTVSKNLRGGYSVGVSGQKDSYVTDFGRSSSGGGVIVIDRVLVPKEEQVSSGLPWWAILLIVLAVLIGLTLLAVAGYYGYQWYQNREGQVSLPTDTT